MSLKSGPFAATSSPCRVLGTLVIFSLMLFFFPGQSDGRIYIDINAPSVQKFRIAIPDFKNLTRQNTHQDQAAKLIDVIINDLDYSGYFSRIDKAAYLVGEGDPLNPSDIRFKDWTVIGAELLLYGNYTCIDKNLEVEVRLFDVFSGSQLLGKKVLGDITKYRDLVHRLSNEIILTLTGHPGIFLTKLAFVSDTSGHKEIYTCDYDGHNVRQVTKDRIIAMMPRLCPDGKKIAYTSYKEGSPMLYLRDIVTGSEKRLSGRAGLNSGVSWFPGGNSVAMTISQNENPDIYMVDLDGKILKRLTTFRGIDVSPSISPKGDKVAFVSDRSGSPQIYVLDLSSGKTDRLTFNGQYNTSPSWSCLNQIAYVSRDGKFDIFSIDANGGQLRRLTENQGNNEDPCWSPEGRYIVFSSKRDGAYGLYIMNANGQNQRKIKLFSGNQTSPSWAP
jgi:TolB protein